MTGNTQLIKVAQKPRSWQKDQTRGLNVSIISVNFSFDMHKKQRSQQFAYFVRYKYVTSSTTVPATPTLQLLIYELSSVENWHLLGVNLGLMGHQLRKIEHTYHGDSKRCKTEALDLWQRNARNCTWEAVAKALDLMQEEVVADWIREKYCHSTTATGKYNWRILISLLGYSI